MRTPIPSFTRRALPSVLVDALVVTCAFYGAALFRVLDAAGQLTLAQSTDQVTRVIPLVVVFFIAINLLFGLDSRIWRFATAYEVVAIFLTASASTLTIAVADLTAGLFMPRPLPLGVLALGGFLSFCGMVAVRYRFRLWVGLSQWQGRRGSELIPTLIYGAEDSGQVLAWRLLNQMEGKTYRLVGFIDDDRAKVGLRIHGIKVLGTRDDLPRIVESKHVELIILALSQATGEELREVLSIAQATPAQVRIFPNLADIMSVANSTPLTREIRVEDLLGRKRVAIDEAACADVLRGKIVLVTGGCGSVGSELCRQAAGFTPEHLIVVDNNESGLFDLEIGLRGEFPGLFMTFIVGDVTDIQKMERIFGVHRPQVVFHAAAYKHVPLMQYHPEEAIRVNVGGTLCTLDMSRRSGTNLFVLVSTDKAVNPGSVMGATKRVAELLAMHGDELDGTTDDRELLCTAVRFGNVLGSRGSVVPTFMKQIDMGGPVTVTHPEMTRYFMDMREAASLIIQAASLTRGQDTFMLEMGERIKVDDLARKMIRMRGLRPEIDIPIVYTGIRPGEKLHEELVHAEEEIAKTSHPLIYRVVGGAAMRAIRMTREPVERLIEHATHGHRDEVITELMSLARNGGPLATVDSRPRVMRPIQKAAAGSQPD